MTSVHTKSHTVVEQLDVAMSAEAGEFDDARSSAFVDAMCLDKKVEEEGTEEDRKVLAEIQSWFRRNTSIVCRIIGPVRLMARVASS